MNLDGLNSEIVFSPSGTDSVIHALFLAQSTAERKTMYRILVASDETGSGVRDAISGRHFNSVTSEGTQVTKGAPISGLCDAGTVECIPVYDADGRMYEIDEIDARVYRAVGRAIARGESVLLQVMDSSKLGNRSTSLAMLARLNEDFDKQVQVVVDACQMRISLPRLRWHLASGHMVLISGSKFFTGPPFSGALLVPSCVSDRVKKIDGIPAGLCDYTNQNAWPQAWGNVYSKLPERHNFGQYFRWVAASAEMERYFSIPVEFRERALYEFGKFTVKLIGEHSKTVSLFEQPRFSVECVPDFEMAHKTIFPFSISDRNKPLSFDEAVVLHRALNTDMRNIVIADYTVESKRLSSVVCHVGQAVSMRSSNGGTRGLLRICSSARTVCDLWDASGNGAMPLSMPRQQEQQKTVFDKLELLTKHFSQLT